MASSLPDELLIHILQNAAHDRACLAVLCLVSRHIRRLVLPWLYGDISRLKSTESVHNLFATLSSSHYLCPLAVSLDLTPRQPHDDEAFFISVNESLRRMPDLKALSLPTGYPTSMLTGCPFQLRTLSCGFDDDEALEEFFRTQRVLEELQISGARQTPKGIDKCILPRLGKVRATAAWLQALVPSRSVHTVEVLDNVCWQRSWLLLSDADHIRSLTLSSSCLFENSDWVRQLKPPMHDLTVTGLDPSTDCIPRVLSHARALDPENLELFISATNTCKTGLTCQEVYVTMQHFLNPAPPSLRRLFIKTTKPEGAVFCRRWLFHPVLEIFTLLVD